MHTVMRHKVNCIALSFGSVILPFHIGQRTDKHCCYDKFQQLQYYLVRRVFHYSGLYLLGVQLKRVYGSRTPLVITDSFMYFVSPSSFFILQRTSQSEKKRRIRHYSPMSIYTDPVLRKRNMDVGSWQPLGANPPMGNTSKQLLSPNPFIGNGTGQLLCLDMKADVATECKVVGTKQLLLCWFYF